MVKPVKFPRDSGFLASGEFLAIFNLENIIFQVVVVERFHSITPSLLVRHLETRGELPCAKARSARGKI